MTAEAIVPEDDDPEPEGHDAHLYYAEPDEDCDDCIEASQQMWQQLMSPY